jgi:hypothetical protein
MKLFAVLPLGFLFVTNMALAAQVSAKKDGTQIISEPKKGAAVVKELKKGELIESFDRSGMFWKVKTSEGKEGYVSVMAVQREAEKTSGIQSALHDAAMKARNSTDGGETTRARSAVMGVRGLNENNELAEVGSLRPDLRAVYHMEDRALNEKRVDRLEALVLKEVENTAIGQSKK